MKITSLKVEDVWPIKQAKVKEYEKQIDQMVYEFYRLAKEEVKIVESSI